MSTENLEYLLEKLISVNEQILETVIDIKSEVQNINKELNWVEEYSYAKMVYGSLKEIELKLFSIDSGVSTVEKELDWSGKHSYAKVVYDGLNIIENKLDSIESGISNIDLNTTGL
ncbi:hypothetical protein [Photobacterium leiognathi]|uniref:hypothetical protein n=1 Tax=Photobacterium leiognathi TaxID=553611 RepID=UPI00273A1654|nr:hypothetical protein [Photobacterium leiognathi]